MSGFSELIKNFDKTRDYVRDFFIYGFKVRSDFDKKSLRTYDDEKRRVESWLGDNLRYDESVRGRQVSISVNSGHISENPLYKAYYSKSFTDNDIKLHFMLCDILQNEKRLSLKELTERLSDNYGEIFEMQTVRNKLKEYVNEGIFACEKCGKTDYFSLSCDTFESFFVEYQGLDDAVKFFSEGSEFGVIGNYLLKTAEMENDLFCMKHNFIVHTLEDIILPEIIEAIEEKKYISFITFSSKASRISSAENMAVPMQIFSCVQTGRRYLLAYLPKFRRYNAFRLDYIKGVKKGGICDKFDAIREVFERNKAHCFGVSFGERRDTGAVEPTVITVEVNEKTEDYIIERLYREKRIGSVQRLSEGRYVLTADVFDPSELMHWAKTLIGRIVSVEGGCESVRSMFFNDVQRLMDMYDK
ncbi:MAG: WYL domain-containing protein [Oscillospiraceae bacterium]|nr:WYL domain-containing protein [Oscillospiraceae bacterium]